jgi:hypothetical protein
LYFTPILSSQLFTQEDWKSFYTAIVEKRDWEMLKKFFESEIVTLTMDLNSRYMFLIDLVLLPPIKVKTKFDDDEPEPTIFGFLFKIL